MTQSQYKYSPSLVAAIIWASLYSIAFAITFVLCIKNRAWVWQAMVFAAGSKSLLVVLRLHDY
jgi:hypothetical protein